MSLACHDNATCNMTGGSPKCICADGFNGDGFNCTGEHACMHSSIDANIHTYIHTYIHAHIHTCTHTYIHAHIHTYIHTFTSSKERLTFWDINCAQYSAAVALLEHSGKLSECTKKCKIPDKRPWELQAESQINAIRRKMSHITLILQCSNRNTMTKKQKEITTKIKNLCGNLKVVTLNSKLATLNHQLKVCTMKLQDNRKKAERSRINSLFNGNQKRVFRMTSQQRNTS